MGDRITGTAERETGQTVRWRQRGQRCTAPPCHGVKPSPTATDGLGLLLAALTLVAVLAVSVRLATRRRVPGDPVRPQVVEPFSLKDTRGRIHELADWRDARAVVLFVIGTERPASRGFAPEMRRLAEHYGPEGVLFFGLHLDPAVPADAVAAVRARARPGVSDSARPCAGAGGRPGSPCHSRGGAGRRPGASPLFGADRRPVGFGRQKSLGSSPPRAGGGDRRGGRRVRASDRADRGIRQPPAEARTTGRIRPDAHLP